MVGVFIEIREKKPFTQDSLLLCHKTVIETVTSECPQCRGLCLSHSALVQCPTRATSHGALKGSVRRRAEDSILGPRLGSLLGFRVLPAPPWLRWTLSWTPDISASVYPAPSPDPPSFLSAPNAGHHQGQISSDHPSLPRPPGPWLMRPQLLHLQQQLCTDQFNSA